MNGNGSNPAKSGYSQRYKDYLQTEHWLILRDIALTDAKGKPRPCACCLSTEYIEAHHIVYRQLNDCVPSDILPLCRPCHQVLHDAKRLGEFTNSELARLAPEPRVVKIRHIIREAKARRKIYNRTASLNTLYLRRPAKSARFLSYADYQKQFPAK